MEVEDEIFEEFFQQLNDDEDFPDEVLDKLKKLKKSNEIISKDLILKSIKQGVSNEDQKH